MDRVIDASNFHLNTFGVFARCPTPRSKPSYVSATGSKYWVIGDVMVRLSDHWGHKIAGCAWVLNLGHDKQNEWITAKIKFTDMTERNSPLNRKSIFRRQKYKRRIDQKSS